MDYGKTSMQPLYTYHIRYIPLADRDACEYLSTVKADNIHEAIAILEADLGHIELISFQQVCED